MSDRFFLDTNIFVYSFAHEFPAKKKIAQQLIGEALQEGRGIISYQVVQEFMNVCLQRFKRPMSWEDAHDYLEQVLSPLCLVYPSHDLFKKALRVRHEVKYRFYDSLVVASAIEAGCRVLYSEDLQDGQKIEGLTVKNPFKNF